MIQNQPPNQPERLKTILCVNIHTQKIRISWKCRVVKTIHSATGPTQTACALLLGVNNDYVSHFQRHAHPHKKSIPISVKKEFILA